MIRFLNFINLLFIYYLGRGGGDNDDNNNQESDGEGSRSKNLFLLDFRFHKIYYYLFII